MKVGGVGRGGGRNKDACCNGDVVAGSDARVVEQANDLQTHPQGNSM